MSGVKSRVGSLVVVAEAFFLLLPTTLLYFFAAFFLLVTLMGAGSGDTWKVALIMSLPGYGLYSLWWLVIKHRRVAFSDVPKYIWIGTGIGNLLSLIWAVSFMFQVLWPQPEFISYPDDVELLLIGGAGPLIVTLTILMLMRPSRSEDDRF